MTKKPDHLTSRDVHHQNILLDQTHLYHSDFVYLHYKGKGHVHNYYVHALLNL